MDEQSIMTFGPVGADELAHERVLRILAHHASKLVPVLDVSVVPLNPTLHKDSAWEELLRVAEAEIGFVHVDATSEGVPTLRFLSRDAWTTDSDVHWKLGYFNMDTAFDSGEVFGPAPRGSPVLELECDAVVGATVGQADRRVVTRVTGQRPAVGPIGEGAEITQAIPYTRPVVPQTLARTDLVLRHDSDVTAWVASLAASLTGSSGANLEDVTIRPAATPEQWPAVLGVRLVEDRVLFEWLPPGEAVAYVALGRVIGISHSITAARWETRWTLADVAVTSVEVIQVDWDFTVTGGFDIDELTAGIEFDYYRTESPSWTVPVGNSGTVTHVHAEADQDVNLLLQRLEGDVWADVYTVPINSGSYDSDADPGFTNFAAGDVLRYRAQSIPPLTGVDLDVTFSITGYGVDWTRTWGPAPE